jgi:hypothetical protein
VHLKRYDTEIVQNVGICAPVHPRFPLTSYSYSAVLAPIIKLTTVNDPVKVSLQQDLELWIVGMLTRWPMVWVTSRKANGSFSSYFISGLFFMTMLLLDMSTWTTFSSRVCVFSTSIDFHSSSFPTMFAVSGTRICGSECSCIRRTCISAATCKKFGHFLFPSSIYQHTSSNARQRSLSTSTGVSAERKENPWNADGQMPTMPLVVLQKWAQDIAEMSWTITSAITTGRRWQKWVRLQFFGIHDYQMNQVAGVSLANKLKIGMREMGRYQAYHEDWAESLLENQTAKWEKELTEWEEDHSALNPYAKRFTSELGSKPLPLTLF